MVEVIRALTDAVDKVGLVAVLILVIAAAAGYIVYWNRRLVDKLTEMQTITIDRNTRANADNTQALHGLSTNVKEMAEWMKKMGSDPMGVCKVAAVLEAKGVMCTQEQLERAIEIVMRRQRDGGKDAPTHRN